MNGGGPAFTPTPRQLIAATSSETANTTMLLDQAINLFDLSRVGRAKSTRRWYRRMLRPLAARFPAKPANQITLSDLQTLHAQLEARHLSAATIRAHLRAVRVFFCWLEEEAIIPTDPSRRLKLPRLPISPPKSIKFSHVQKLLNAAHHPRDKAMIIFLADTACRAAGLAGLTIADLDLDNRQALVTEKGQKSRIVYLSPNTVLALQTWLDAKTHHSPHVFTGQRGPLTPSGVYQALKRIARRAGVKRFNPHAFRHGWARAALQAGADMATVSQILGHSSIDVTHRFYARWTDDELKQRHSKFSWMNHPDEDN